MAGRRDDRGPGINEVFPAAIIVDRIVGVRLWNTRNLANRGDRAHAQRHPISRRSGRARALVVAGLLALSGCKSDASKGGSVGLPSHVDDDGLPSEARLAELEARAGERLKIDTALPSRADVVAL